MIPFPVLFPLLFVPVQEREPQNLRLEIRIPERELVLFEPVYYEVLVTALEPISAQMAFSQPFGPSVLVSDDRKAYVGFMPSWFPQGEPVSPEIVRLESSEERSLGPGVVYHMRRRDRDREPEGASADTRVFPRAGQYSLKAAALVSDARGGAGQLVESDPVTIDFLAPSGKDEEAARFIEDRDIGHLIGLVFTSDQMNARRTLVDEFLQLHGESRYASYFRLSIGVWLIRPILADVTKRNVASIGEAIEYLKAAADEKDHPIAGDALYYLGRAYAFAGDRAEARRCLEAAVEAENCRLKEAAKEALKNLPPE